MPALNLVTLVIADMEASVDFYRRLGVDVPDGGPPPWDAHHRSVSGDDGGGAGGAGLDFDSLGFAPMWNQGSVGRPHVIVGFACADRDEVDRIYGELTGAGHAGQQEPFDAFWGARYAVVTDPDGNAVGLMSPIDPDRRTPPPDPPA